MIDAGAIPLDVCVLRYCRCSDCTRWWQPTGWPGSAGFCPVAGVGPGHDHDAWLYCLDYDGPKTSDEVCVWPHARHTRAPDLVAENAVKNESKRY